MATSPRLLGLVFFSVGLAMGACSSGDEAPGPGPGASSTGGDGGAGGDSEAACVGDNGAIAEDDSESCCSGLFKSCPNIQMANNPKPCVCSTVECGTEDRQPPPNVNCCPGVRAHCTSVLGSNQMKCVCGDP